LRERQAGEEARMTVESMDAARIIGYFKGKSVLITGSTGFLGKSMLSLLNLLQDGLFL
jgi:alcohol-forming fatty acyl-CoA reductase